MPELTTPRGNIPQRAQSSLKLEKFRGVDLTSGAVNVDKSRSPDAVNIMPDEDGFPIKRPGWRCVRDYGAKIWGAHRFTTAEGEKLLVHAGTQLWMDGRVLYGRMAAAPSQGVQFGGKLWLVDGQTYLYCGEKDGAMVCEPVTEIATVPMITIAKAPNGENGATSYQAVNLLTGRRTDSYMGTAATASQKKYYLSFNGLSPAEVTVKQLKKNADTGADWVELEASTYTVDRAVGLVTFTTAPGASPLEGEDNVRITYEVEESHEAKINACRYAIMYGVRGAMDRIFLAGSPDEPNVDYWSDFADPAYMGDVFYGLVGQEGSAIVGYNVLNDKLVTHKKGEENQRNIFVRYGSLDDEGFASFELQNVLQGEGALSERCFASLAGEPLFLTGEGVYALTPGDITGERYAQRRSYYIDKGGFLREEGLSGASACAWGRFYVLAVNGKLYLLDSGQKSYEARQPYSTYQFEGYVWEGVPAAVVYEFGGKLCFGTEDGRVCEFQSGRETRIFADVTGRTTAAGEPEELAIACRWATPLMELDNWGRLKTVTGVWLALQPYTRSGCRVFYATDKEHEKLVREALLDIFDWNDIDFGRFTFNTLDRPMIVATNRKAKKVKLFQVILKNEVPREPMGFMAIQIDFRVGGRIK